MSDEMRSPRDPREITRTDNGLISRIFEGVKELATPVGESMGPKGRTTLMRRLHLGPLVSKDGVTIAREVHLEDEVADMAVSLVREAAERTNQTSGDATSTSTVLAASFLDSGFDAIISDVDPKSPVSVKRELDKMVEEAVKELKEIGRKVEGEEIEKVAAISANDKEIGKLIYDVMKDDPKRIVTVEESSGSSMSVETVDGFRIEKGMISPYMMTDATKNECVLENPYIMVVDGKLSSIDDVVSAMGSVAESSGKKSLLVIAEDVDGEALATLLVNKMKGLLLSAAVKSTGYGETRIEILKDIAALTGAEIVGSASGVKASEVKIGDLGFAKKAIISRDFTTIVGSKGDKKKIQERMDGIEKAKEEAKSKFDKDRLQERASRLHGGVSIIKVGAPTESEISEIRDRVEDALQATAAAVEEGVVPGGGQTLIWIANKLAAKYPYFCKALETPARCIMSNAGLTDDEVDYRIIKMSKEFGVGYDMSDPEEEKTVKLMEVGIIDPVKAIRCALENSASVAGLLLTSGTAITYKPKKDKN